MGAPAKDSTQFDFEIIKMTEEVKFDSPHDLAAPVTPVIVANPPAVKPGKDAQKKEESDSPFAVSVTDVYEGPLDLLLDLIRKQDIDIYAVSYTHLRAHETRHDL